MTEKISVIIPTLLYNTEILQTLLKILNDDVSVDEIILINNSGNPLVTNFNVTKLKHCQMPENMYVNPSWNYGISIAKNDIFLIINDDIICCKNFCSLVLNTGIFDYKNTGLVGLDNSFINKYSKNQLSEQFYSINKEYDSNDIKFFALKTYKNLGDWGSAFMGRKKSYYEIPNKYKIVYGDNYLIKKNIEAGNVNYMISGLLFNHLHSLSSKAPVFRRICLNDYAEADDDFKAQ